MKGRREQIVKSAETKIEKKIDINDYITNKDEDTQSIASRNINFKINANKLLMLITSDNEIVTTSGNEMITTSTNENNTTNNNIYNNINNNNKKERKKTSYDEILNSMVEDDDVKNTICDYIKMRKLIKKPMTDRAVTMLINKLYKLSNNKQIQIKILEQSILKNWTDIYPYKEENNYAGYQGNAKTDLSKYDR